jgi:O-antigen ligase
MNREVVERWCERGVVGLLLAILVFGPLAMGAVPTQAFLVIQVLTMGVLALWMARIWTGARPKVLWPPICWAVLAFAVYGVIRYLRADVEYAARQELIEVLIYAFLFFAIVNHLHTQERTLVVSYTLIFLAMAISFYALYQYVTDSNRVWQLETPYRHRGTGTYISPNHLGGFLEMILPLALAFTLASRVKPVGKILAGYAALVILAGIVVTLSRGSWISTALSLLPFFAVLSFHRAHRIPALLLLLAIFGTCIFLIPKTPSFESRNSKLFEGGRVDDDLRFELWRPAIQIWKDNVWWGAGPGHFDHLYRKYRPPTIQLQAYRAHNDYLNTLADWGVAGTALVALAWVLLGVGIVRTWRVVRVTPRDIGENKGSNKFAFLLGASFGLVAILIHSVVDFNMHIPANAILAVALMALVSSHLRFATERYWVTVTLWRKAAASGVLIAGLACLGEQGWRRYAEQGWLEQAGGAPNFSPQQVDFLRRAFAAEPMDAETACQAGEALRRQSQEGGEYYEGAEGQNYRKLAEQAMEWFERSMKLDRWNGKSYLGYGWCLDWLGRTGEAGPYFAKAEELDPNGNVTIATIGLHYVELGDYAAAREWFKRSLGLQWAGNLIASNYLEIANLRLAEAATNDISARLRVPAR